MQLSGILLHPSHPAKHCLTVYTLFTISALLHCPQGKCIHTVLSVNTWSRQDTVKVNVVGKKTKRELKNIVLIL